MCGKLDERHHVWVKNYTDNSGAGKPLFEADLWVS